MRWLRQITFAVWLAVCGVVCGPAWGQSTQPATAPGAPLRGLIAQLGDKQWAMREAAHRKLRTIRDPAVVPALREAATSSDLERAFRAKGLLDELLNFTHVVLDGLGEPIADATITLVGPEPGALPLTVTTNMFGGVTLPPLINRPQGLVRFQHRQFGSAQGPEPYSPWRPETPGPFPPTPISVPIVTKDSPAYARALRGQVVGPDGKAVAGAEVSCRSVRTHGQGTIWTNNATPSVLTDDEGRFSFYLPAANSNAERGLLIPLHSVYQIAIRAPGVGPFPYAGEHDNAVPVVIRIVLPERFHRFEFETIDGERVSGSAMDNVSLTYRPISTSGVVMDPVYAREGGKLLPGFYTARSGNLEYLPIEVTKDSPEMLLFRPPPPMTYRGRVVDGVTGKPMPGAFVINHMGGAEIFATLKDADWAALEALPAGPTKDAPALNRLRNNFFFRALLRTDDQGRYEIREPVSANVSGLLAFARGRLPCSVNTANAGRTPEDKSPLCDLPLFPAARVTVQPVCPANVSTTTDWELSPEGQPEWFDRFKAVFQGPMAGAQIAARSWLSPNQPKTIYVPADVRLTLVLHAPNNDELCSARIDKPIQLPPGGDLNVGQVTFEPALPMTVRVTDPAGKPVPGVPVRRMVLPSDTWSPAHLTDADGLARLHVPKNSHGYFSVPDLLRTGYVRTHPGRATIPFQIESTAPAQPPTIPLTAAQVQALSGRPPASDQ